MISQDLASLEGEKIKGEAPDLALSFYPLPFS